MTAPTHYRADWINRGDDDAVQIRDFGSNLKAAQAFARRKSGEPAKPGPTVYIIASDDNGDDLGQWAYFSGFTYGYETA